ncbi:MAG TPA: FAD-dependent oxidoreductase [Myxococcota bacterium]|nr:FAD-dependent oxidoreductase [Myxococcota bacterium]
MALRELTDILGPENIDAEALTCFPNNVDEIIRIVKTTRRLGVKVRAVSTGRNWGYHTFFPKDKDCWTLNLSRMNRIIDFDRELGVVTIEPGVTQQDLKTFIDNNNLPFIVPTTGAGPTCSIMGNILERGYGVTQYFDSFASCMSLEAILPDGNYYRSPLLALGGHRIGRIYKWGVGPYVDGIFSQSHHGICISMNVALKRRTSGIMAVFFETDRAPATLINPIVNILHVMGGLLGPIKITNHHRLLAILDQAPELRSETPLEKSLRAQEFFLANGIPHWQGFFAAYTDDILLRSVQQLVENALKTSVRRLYCRIDNQEPAAARERLFLDLVTGTPNHRALPLTYFRAPKLPGPDDPFSPEKDGAGILWYAPLIPATQECVELYLDFATNITTRFGFEPAITFTSLSDRCFDSVLPILFNGHDANQAEKARACYRALFHEGQQQGIIPYRVPECFRDLIIKSNREVVFGQNLCHPPRA